MLDALVPSVADKMVRVPVAPGCIYLGFCPISLVLTCAASASAMHWASMAMHHTASLFITQAASDGKVTYNNNKNVTTK